MRIIQGLIALAVCGMLISVPSVAASPCSDSTVGIQCISSLMSWRVGDPLQDKNAELLRAWSEERGIPIVPKAEWAVWIDAFHPSSLPANQLLASVGIARALPNEAIDVGKRAEVFYAFLPADRRAALPKDGAWVRQMMTEEFLSQFVMPIEQRLEVIDRAQLGERLKTILDDLVFPRIRRERN